MSIAVAVAGGNGRMGRALIDVLGARSDLTLSALTLAPGSKTPAAASGVPLGPVADDIEEALGNADVLVDFTAPSAVAAHAAACERQHCAWVLGTTGLNAQQQQLVEGAARAIPVCQAANFSRGVTLMLAVLRQLAAGLDEETDVEIIEAHHRGKRDAPSGTALAMGRAVAEGRAVTLDDYRTVHREGWSGGRSPGAIGFATLRAGDIVGEHTALFADDGERLEITHRATSREAFAQGACRAAQWLVAQPPGLYDMQDVLGLRKED